MPASIKGLTDLIRKAEIEARDEIADMILPLQKSQTPVLTGALRDSEHVEKYQTEDKIGVNFVAPKDYALDQHENPNYIHPHGGKMKFLLDPLTSSTEQAIEIVKTKISDRLKGG